MSGTRPFVDRRVDDIEMATALARHAARSWGLPEPTLLRHGMNAIFVAGDDVLRVGSPSAAATAALDLASALTARGLRVTRPRRDDAITAGHLSVTCWELIERTEEGIDWEAVGRMVRALHALDATVVPAAYPVASPTAFPWWHFDSSLAEVGDTIDASARAGLEAAIQRWPTWRELADPVLCHGDVHPGNIVMSADGPVLIDWDLLCLAPRGWDHAPMMTWASRWGGGLDVYERLADGYGQSLRDDPAAQAFAELRLVAATLMRVRAGRNDSAAWPEAERRLAYWRGDPDAPAWRAQ